ncbi:Ig-like domain-containing protein [Bacillota bacterium LX-D]|nr:Ig-like domain-containing protein [Bacillota bacterium LX-D]
MGLELKSIGKKFCAALVTLGMVSTIVCAAPAASYASSPEISSCDPENRDTDIPVDTDITIRFSKSMKASTLEDEDNIYLVKDGSSRHVECDYDYNSSTRTVTITPHDDLQEDTKYYIYVTNDVEDSDGNAFEGDGWYFTTEENSDSDSEYIEDRDPDDGDDDVPVDTKITFYFTEDMDENTVEDTDNIYLRKSGSSRDIDIDISYSTSSNKVTITPDEDLDEDESYIVYVTDDVKTEDGDRIDSESWEFTTEANSNDESNVEISSTDPDANDTDVQVDAPITIKFDGKLRSSTVTTDNIYLRKSNSNSDIDCNISYNSSTKTVILSPKYDLDENTTYTVYVTDDVQDEDRNNLDSYSWKFTTESAETDAEVYLKSPLPGSTSAPISGGNFYAIFSNGLEESTVNESNVYLTKKSTPTVLIPVKVSYTSSSYTIHITPVSNLEYNTEYTIYLSSFIQDENGKYIEPVNWSFKTVTNPNPPSTTPSTNTGTKPSTGSTGTTVTVKPGNSKTTTIIVNGKTLTLTDAAPYTKNQRTMVPFRALLEALGATVQYDTSTPKQPKIICKLNTTQIVLKINQKTAMVNNQTKTLDVAPEIVKSRAMIPLRFVSESLGATVVWNKTANTITITK